MNDAQAAKELVAAAREMIGARRTENVHRLGGGWVWLHDDGQEESLPYWGRTKRNVRDFIQERLDDRRMDDSFVIRWD